MIPGRGCQRCCGAGPCAARSGRAAWGASPSSWPPAPSSTCSAAPCDTDIALRQVYRNSLSWQRVGVICSVCSLQFTSKHCHARQCMSMRRCYSGTAHCNTQICTMLVATPNRAKNVSAEALACLENTIVMVSIACHKCKHSWIGSLPAATWLPAHGFCALLQDLQLRSLEQICRAVVPKGSAAD